MNPKIQELAAQAGATDEQGNRAKDVFCFTAQELQSFAELIVRECVSLARHDAVRKMSGDDIAGMIEMHFGIER